jgi:hypothetical protein
MSGQDPMKPLAPTPLQVGCVALRTVVFEAKQRLSEREYDALLEFAAALIAREIAASTRWEERPS